MGNCLLNGQAKIRDYKSFGDSEHPEPDEGKDFGDP